MVDSYNCAAASGTKWRRKEESPSSHVATKLCACGDDLMAGVEECVYVCVRACAGCVLDGARGVCRRDAGVTVGPPVIPAKWCANLAAERRK